MFICVLIVLSLETWRVQFFCKYGINSYLQPLNQSTNQPINEIWIINLATKTPKHKRKLSGLGLRPHTQGSMLWFEKYQPPRIQGILSSSFLWHPFTNRLSRAFLSFINSKQFQTAVTLEPRISEPWTVVQLLCFVSLCFCGYFFI